jgi:hypothetical protein
MILDEHGLDDLVRHARPDLEADGETLAAIDIAGEAPQRMLRHAVWADRPTGCRRQGGEPSRTRLDFEALRRV